MTTTMRLVIEDSLSIRKRIGQRIARLRNRRDWSQRWLATAVGIAQPTLSNYESGERDIPLVTALRLAVIFEEPIDSIADTDDVLVASVV